MSAPFILALALVGANGAANNSQQNLVFYAQEACETAKAQWLSQFREVPQVKAFAQCYPRTVSEYGSIILDKPR